MYKTSKPYTEFTCAFELFNDMIKTKSDDPKFKNHAILQRESAYSFMEFNHDFVTKALNSLKQKTQLVALGIDEFTPPELLLFEFLKEYGFRNAVSAIEENRLNTKE